MWIPILIAILSAYLLGSIPSSVWIGKIFYGTDVREHGSGNAGTTNTIRVLGYKAGIPVFIIDALKGWFAVFLTKIIFGSGHLRTLWFRELYQLCHTDFVAGALKAEN